jgi:hypothetical protein
VIKTRLRNLLSKSKGDCLFLHLTIHLLQPIRPHCQRETKVEVGLLQRIHPFLLLASLILQIRKPTLQPPPPSLLPPSPPQFQFMRSLTPKLPLPTLLPYLLPLSPIECVHLPISLSLTRDRQRLLCEQRHPQLLLVVVRLPLPCPREQLLEA